VNWIQQHVIMFAMSMFKLRVSVVAILVNVAQRGIGRLLQSKNRNSENSCKVLCEGRRYYCSLISSLFVPLVAAEALTGRRTQRAT